MRKASESRIFGRPKRAATVFVFITATLDVLSFGMVIPVLPALIVGFAGDTARGALVYGLFGTLWAVAQFFSAPVLGALSDRYGRRPVILSSCLGLGLDFLLMAVAPSLVWLVIGRLISGVTAAGHVAATAYIADVTPAEQRASSYGVLGAAFGIGLIVGPAAGGLLGSIDPRLPFWAAAFLALTNVAYGWFVLPESLPPERRASFTWAKANPWGALRLLRSHRSLTGFAWVAFLVNVAYASIPGVVVLYLGHRYAWGSGDIGLMLTVMGLSSALAQGLLLKPAMLYLGERLALLLGLACGSAAFIGFAVAPSGGWFLATLPLMALCGLGTPALQGMMTRQVGEHEQGQLQGANSALASVAHIVAPPLFTSIFAAGAAADAKALVGSPYALAALLMVLSTILARRLTRTTTPACALLSLP